MNFHLISVLCSSKVVIHLVFNGHIAPFENVNMLMLRL